MYQYVYLLVAFIPVTVSVPGMEAIPLSLKPTYSIEVYISIMIGFLFGLRLLVFVMLQWQRQ